MLNTSDSAIITKEENLTLSPCSEYQSSGDDDSDFLVADIHEILKILDIKVTKLIDYVMNDVHMLNKISKKKAAKQDADKENINDDKWKCRIYVGNVDPNTSIESLKNYFSMCCDEVVHAYFFRFFPNCKNAFVEFKNQSSVEKALKQNHVFEYRTLNVGPAKRRSDNGAMKEPLNFKAKSTDLKVLRYRPY
ncbi:uncharacterized protein [Chironomus tepperi]|uniref:uncharacterized protein n=1 Tax=Chironomus tepperi TaxID=113505 RepID=UPI00391F301B